MTIESKTLNCLTRTRESNVVYYRSLIMWIDQMHLCTRRAWTNTKKWTEFETGCTSIAMNIYSLWRCEARTSFRTIFSLSISLSLSPSLRLVVLSSTWPLRKMTRRIHWERTKEWQKCDTHVGISREQWSSTVLIISPLRNVSMTEIVIAVSSLSGSFLLLLRSRLSFHVTYSPEMNTDQPLDGESSDFSLLLLCVVSFARSLSFSLGFYFLICSTQSELLAMVSIRYSMITHMRRSNAPTRSVCSLLANVLFLVLDLLLFC
jgi:hypothetical protein